MGRLFLNDGSCLAVDGKALIGIDGRTAGVQQHVELGVRIVTLVLARIE